MKAIIEKKDNICIAKIEILGPEEIELIKESLKENIKVKKEKLKICDKYIHDADEEERLFLRENQERISNEIISLVAMIEELGG